MVHIIAIMLERVNLVFILAKTTNWNIKAIIWEMSYDHWAPEKLECISGKQGFLSKSIMSILALVATLLPIDIVPGVLCLEIKRLE
jgi:hypothetical protein